jgi:uncharacterized integral membrane protein
MNSNKKKHLPDSLKKYFFWFLSFLFSLILLFLAFNEISISEIVFLDGTFSLLNIFIVLISFILGFLSHWIRAQRWGQMLISIYNFRGKILFESVMIGLTMNYALPRLGDVIRCSIFSSVNKFSFQSTLGTLILERIIDILILGSLIIFSMLLLPETRVLDNFEAIQFVYLAVLALFFLVSVSAYFKFKFKFLNFLINKIKKLISGITVYKKINRKGLFFLNSLLIWGLYFSLFYVFSFSYNQDVLFGHLFIGFVSGAIAMSTTNGGIGSYPLFVGETFKFLGYSAEFSYSYAWSVWITQTVIVLSIGLISFFIINRKTYN